MNKPLTKLQKRCMSKLSMDKWQSAYELEENLNTLNGLHKRRLVIAKGMQGSYFYPRTNLLWKLKNKWSK